MKSDRIIKIIGWSIFALALLVYALTAQRSVMFWDSGEFISSSYKLHSTHPPGTPLYSLITRVFTIFFPKSSVAFACSFFSGICGAFTVWFLFHIIIWVGNKIMERIGHKANSDSLFIILFSAVVGSLTLLFSDTFWVASTEAEVYTLSSLLIAAIFWGTCQWEKRKQNKWMLFLAYLLGLSVGVHILNLAVIFPVVMFIWLQKKGVNIKSIFISLGAGLLLFVIADKIMIKGLLKILIKTEVFFTNSLSLSQHMGTLIALTVCCALMIATIYWSRKKGKKQMELIVLSIALFTIGWSSYTMSVLRSDVHSPTSNNSNDVLRLMDYMNSNQYNFSDRPLLFGHNYNSILDPSLPYVDRDPILSYSEKEKRYVVTDDGKNRVPNYHQSTKSLFPRMFDRTPFNAQQYQQWVNIQGKNVIVDNKRVKVPVLGDNLAFFFKYQLGWLNIRYFLWNFVGRQNDWKGSGIPSSGNWMSGIPFVDASRVGSSNITPAYFANYDAQNTFYGIPLLLGVVGLVCLYLYHKRLFLVTLIFFLAFGVAITIFINQLPIHVLIRERDYIFLGAYFAFCIWVGLSVLAISFWVPNVLHSRKKIIYVGAACLLAPMLMAFKGWKDHNRSDDIIAQQIAKNMLDQCEHNSILIVSGDNIIFPLWYMQEVEEYRTDVRVLDYNLMNLEWYIDRMKLKMNRSANLTITLPETFYRHGKPTLFSFLENERLSEYAPLRSLIKYIVTQNNVPTDNLSLNFDTLSFKEIAKANPFIHDLPLRGNIDWTLTKEKYSLNDIVLLDILAHNTNNRTLHFSNTGTTNILMGLENYLIDKGLVYQLVPIQMNKEKEHLLQHTDMISMDSLITNKMNFDYLSNYKNHIPYTNIDFAKQVYRPIFFKLALSYFLKQDAKNCLRVLQQCERAMPDANVPYQNKMFEMAMLYHKIGAYDDWRRVVRIVMYNLMDEMEWYISFEPKHNTITVERTKGLGGDLAMMMTEIGKIDTQLTNELQPKLDKLRAQFDTWVLLNEPS